MLKLALQPFLFVCLMMKALSFQAQTEILLSSTAELQTCVDESQCFSINNSALLFYDEPKEAFFLRMDLAKFTPSEDSLKNWIEDLGDQFFYVKVPLPKDAFKGGLANNNNKTYEINNALVFLNGIWHDEHVEITLTSASPNNMLDPSPTNKSNDTYADIRATFGLVISPKVYKIHRKSHNLKNPINIGIRSGRINLVRDNMYVLLGEAYEHN